MHQKILQHTRRNTGGKETPTKKHCIVMDKMQFHSLSCDLRQDAYEVQDAEKKLPLTSNRLAVTGFCGTIKRSHKLVLRFRLMHVYD